MFFKKKASVGCGGDAEYHKSETEIPTVQCHTCACFLPKDDAQCVEETGWGVDKYFCKVHVKPYQRMHTDSWGEKVRYVNVFETDEKGEPIGYIKQANEKPVIAPKKK